MRYVYLRGRRWVVDRPCRLLMCPRVIGFDIRVIFYIPSTPGPLDPSDCTTRTIIIRRVCVRICTLCSSPLIWSNDHTVCRIIGRRIRLNPLAMNINICKEVLPSWHCVHHMCRCQCMYINVACTVHLLHLYAIGLVCNIPGPVPSFVVCN